MPAQSKTTSHVAWTQVCELLNGDWADSRYLLHHCRPGCCKDRAHTEAKLISVLPRAWLRLKAKRWAANNWLSWSQQLDFLGWSHCLHQLGSSVLLQVLRGLEVPEDVDEEMGPLGDGGAQDLGHEQHPLLQERPADPVEALRREKSRSLRASLALLESAWWQPFYTMRFALQGEVRLMATLVEMVSQEAEVQQLYAQQVGEPREYAILKLHQGIPQRRMMHEGMKKICDEKIWDQFVETECTRSLIWRFCTRPLAVVWQLLTLRWSQWPWRLFQLLYTHTPEFAAECLRERECLKDQWTLRFLSFYSTVEQLLSPEAFQTLAAIAIMLSTTTYSTERKHAANLRRSALRSQVKRMSVSQVGLLHAAVVAPAWMKKSCFPPQVTQKKKRGRPCGSRAQLERQVPDGGDEAGDEAEGRPVSKLRRTGSGGARRAYLHSHVGKGHSLKSLMESGLATAYHNLSAAERQHYQQLGSLGLLGVRKLTERNKRLADPGFPNVKLPQKEVEHGDLGFVSFEALWRRMFGEGPSPKIEKRGGQWAVVREIRCHLHTFSDFAPWNSVVMLPSSGLQGLESPCLSRLL